MNQLTHGDSASREAVITIKKHCPSGKLFWLAAYIACFSQTFAQSSYVTGKTPGAGMNVFPSSAWRELILNGDGTINWSQYEFVANNYNKLNIIDYRYGPRYNVYHPTPETFPTTAAAGTNSFYGNFNIYNDDALKNDWYAMGGQLLYYPDSPSDKGIARARNGSLYCSPNMPNYGQDLRIAWVPDASNYYVANPDNAVLQPSWVTASNGNVPAPPVAVARAKFINSVGGITVFSNGLVGATSTGNDGNFTSGSGNTGKWPFVKLDDGKIPTAVCLTLNHEFALVTVWDVFGKKGQLAVIALSGSLPSAENRSFWLYSVPNWHHNNDMKLLGYIDLPVAAPTSIESTADIGVGNGRGFFDNVGINLDQQSERDKWLNWTGGSFKKSARAGYAIIASRSENKVVFVDLQPLFQYVRSMYFTTQDNVNSTKNVGYAANQWPHAFSHASQQMPRVVGTVTVNKPTAVAAGYARDGYWVWNNNGLSDEVYRSTAYVTTMDGNLLLYNVGNLNTYATGAKTTPTLTKSVTIGKNPTSIAYGNQGSDVAKDLMITCRGDKVIYHMRNDGALINTYKDSRLIDPVSVEINDNSRWCHRMGFLSVMDFYGRQAVNYPLFEHKVFEGNSSLEWNFRFGHATPVPGMPFMFSVAEVY